MIKLIIAGINGRMGRTVGELATRDDRFDVVAGLVEAGDSALGSIVSIGTRSIPIRDKLPIEQSEVLPLRPCDVLIDFTVADGTMYWLAACEKMQVPMVIGATGHTPDQLAAIRAAAHAIPIVKAVNFSPGVQAIQNALSRLVAELGRGYDIEIVETHHRHKADAPSGTALSLLETIQAALEQGESSRSHAPSAAVRAGPAGASAVPQAATPVIFGRHGRTGERRPGEIGIHAVRMGEHVGQHEIHLSGPGETITLRHTAHTREAFAAGSLRAAAWLVSRPPGLYSMRDVLGS